MGLVYEVLDVERGVRLALKALHSFAGAPDVLRFKAEFRALRDVHHPNLVTLGELVEHEGKFFLTMERVVGTDFVRFVRGNDRDAGEEEVSRDTTWRAPRADPTLRDPVALQGGAPDFSAPAELAVPRFEEARLRAALEQLAAGLLALHDAGKVHRDVKPSNILVTAEGRLKLLDFGVVAELARDPEPNEIVGTVRYMAPEQALGEAPTPAADWYAMGVVLFEALTGKLPFGGRDDHEIIARKCALPAPSPSSLARDLPPDLVALCDQLLTLDPKARPDGRQILSALARRQSARPSPLPEPHTESFVGRGVELSRLGDALHACGDGRAVTVLVEGESGVGKSALVSRFLAHARGADDRMVVLRGRCHERERVPYNALDAAIDDLSRWLSRTSFDVSKLGLPVGPLLTVFPALRAVPALMEHALASSDPGSVPDDRGAAFAALRALFGRVASSFTIVLALDDLQWADADSLALLRELRRGAPPAPLLLVATVRSGAADEIYACLNEGRAELRRLPVGGLSRAEAAELLAARGAACDLDAVLAETRGHPMFIDALASAPQGGLRQAHLDDVLRGQVAALHREARELAEIVSVAGAPIGNDALERVAGISPEAYAGAIATLADARLVRASGTRSADRVEPYHDRVREAVYESLGEERARAIHARIASTLEALGGPADVLYAQFAGARDRPKALHYGILAAESAAGALAFGRAAELYRALLGLGAHSPSDERFLSVALAEALQNDGRATAAAEMFLAAAGIAGTEAAHQRELNRRAAEQLLMSGHVKEGLSAAGSVLGSVGLPMPERPAAILAGAGWNQLRLAMHSLRWEPRGENAVPPRDLERIDACWSIGSGLQMVDVILGSYFQTRGALECLSAGEPFRIARALCTSSIAAAAAGRRSLALRLHEAAKRAAASHGSPVARLYERLAQYGLDYILENDWRACLAGTSEIERLWRRLGRGDGWETDVLHHFACSCMHQLNRPEFKDRVRARIQTAARTGNRFVEVTFRARYADVHLMEDDPREAAADLEDALASWEPAGRSFGNQRMWGLWMRIAIACYAREPLRALPVIRAEAQAMRRSILARLPVFTLGWAMYLAGFELSCAREAQERRDAAAAASHVRAAKRWLSTLGALELPAAAGFATTFDAACSYLQGDVPAARKKLERGIAMTEKGGTLNMATCGKRVLGTLVGGDEGGAMIRDAEASLRAAGVARPERYVATQVPGFPL